MPPSYSVYPQSLDSSSTLPPFTDNITPVNAEGVNRLRDAILRIETELGPEPSATFGNVRNRLDSMDAVIESIPRGLEILDNGTLLADDISSLNFTGGVSLFQSGPTQYTVNISGGGGGGSSLTVQDNLTTLTTAATLLRFTGSLSASLLASGQVEVEGLGLDVRDFLGTVDSNTSILNVTGNVLASNPVAGEVTLDFPFLEVLDGYGVVDSEVLHLNFLNRANAYQFSDGYVNIDVPFLAVADASTTLVNDLYLLKFIGNLLPSATDSTTIEVDTLKSKIKVYNNANITTAAVDVATGVTFGTTSTNVTSTNASSTSTSVSPTVAGQFLITGQVGINPNVSGVSGLLVEVRVNGTTVFSQKHQGLVLTDATVVSTPFSLIANLSINDLVTVRWTHSGSSDSVSQLSVGEDTTWLAITLL